jgi:hypothetical protein
MKPDTIAMLALAVSLAAFLVSAAAVMYTRRNALAAERQAAAAEATIPPPPPPVDWRIEPGHDGSYRLRNTGTGTATGVYVQLPDSFNGQVHVDLGDRSIRAGEAVAMRWYQNWHDPDLNDLPMVWDGQSTPVLVSVPPRPRKPPESQR